ncbi:UNVERIFIED_CONTAM: hypothetical protein GTU68_064947, partial [Idotea baltica]|nr:hypothetical protein [Idotea baltica]
SKSYYQGLISTDKLLLRPESFYTKNKVTLLLGHRVESIDRVAKKVALDNQQTVEYEHLILATGTRARTLKIEGADRPEIHYLRSKDDVNKIKARSKPGAKLLIVGAGYIGLEIAASAIKMGMQVTVLEAMDRVLARVTSPEVSKFYQRIHTEEGVNFRFNTTLTKIIETDGSLSALLSNDEKINFDFAIVGIGVIPNSELAETAGLNCDNGILVNEFTQTVDPSIYAIGDCSNHHSLFYNKYLRLESVPNAVEQAKIAASNICGMKVVYDSLPWFWSDQYDVKLQTAGLSEGYDEIVLRGDPTTRKFSVFYLNNKQLIAVDAINSPAEFMLSKKLIVNHSHPNPNDLADTDLPMKSLLDINS